MNLFGGRQAHRPVSRSSSRPQSARFGMLPSTTTAGASQKVSPPSPSTARATVARRTNNTTTASSMEVSIGCIPSFDPVIFFATTFLSPAMRLRHSARASVTSPVWHITRRDGRLADTDEDVQPGFRHGCSRATNVLSFSVPRVQARRGGGRGGT